MKAILVVDVNMTQDNKHICKDDKQRCPLWNNDVNFCMYNFNNNTKGCPLKPMPYRYVEDKVKIETIRDAEVCTHGIQIGRNMVINEILGEEE